ncbi:MAG TPA: HEAT repeat domain-containing protein [Nitrospira sp.]|nr:HEAT repeat domain-containing protein [Nitrospira sp.]
MHPLNRGQREIFLFVLAWCISVIGSAFGGTTSHIQQSEAFYDRKDYQKALEELDKLDPPTSGTPDARRLRIRILLRLGNPKEALTNYDQLAQVLKHEDPPILREISLGFVLALTKDMREQMRGAAYTALKDWHSSESIPYLEDGLSDGSGLVRALAAEGLAKLDEGRRSVRFRKALEDQAVLVKEAVLKGLAKSDDTSVIPLVEPALKDREVRVRIAAAEVLCHLNRPKGCELLLQYAKAPNPDERTSAIRALVDRQSSEVLSILLESSEHKQPSVRGAAATGFAHVPTAEAVTALTRLLKDPLPPVRIAAAVSFGQLHGFDTRTPLHGALNDRDLPVRAFVIGAVLEQGERYEVVTDAVQTLTGAKEPAVRAAVARALGHAAESNLDPAQSALMLLVQDTVPRVRIAAIKSMAKIGGVSAIPLLKQSLHDEDDAVRATAGGALLKLVPPKE